MKTLIAINNLTTVDQLAYANHCQIWYRLGRNTTDDFALCNPRRMSIDRMRNFAAKAALEHGFDYLLFVDDDVLLPLNFYTRLRDADKDVIAGVTLIRGYPYHPMIFNFLGQIMDEPGKSHFVDDYEKKAGPDGLLECDAVGFSCCLIKTSVLAKMTPPYFITGENHTEDVYFCFRAKQEIPGARIWVDTTVKTAHILGSDIVEPENLAARMAFDEMMNPGLAARSKDADSRQKLIDPKVLRKGDYKEHVRKEIFG